MTTPGFALFETAIGACSIVWGEKGVVGVLLPQAREADMRQRLRKQFPDAAEGAPPKDAKRAIKDMVALLAGEAQALDAIVLDMNGVPPFHRQVYEVARTIPPGATLSYGEIATRLGKPGSARAVGQALGRNPFAIVVPCHRVLAAGGKTGGFSASGGVDTKLRMLAIEGAKKPERKTLFDADGAFDFEPSAALAHLREADARLGRLMDTVGPFKMQLKKTPSLFGALAEAIVYQQLNGKAAATIFGRVCALFPGAKDGPTAAHILRANEAELRGAGLSKNKFLSLKDLAQKSVNGEIPTMAQVHRMENEAIIERLTIVRGIGQWTVEMLLMFRLGRPDVLPVDDYGIRQGYATAFKKKELPTPKELERLGAKWKPYRTVASWYLWRAAELGRKKSEPSASAEG